MKRIITLFLLLFNLSVFAQLTVDVISVPYGTNGNDRLNICDEEETFTVVVSNADSINDATDVLVKFQLPPGVRVENITTPSVSLDAGSTDEFPVFELPNLDAEDDFPFSFTVKATAEVLNHFNFGTTGSVVVQNMTKQVFWKYNSVQQQSVASIMTGYTIRSPHFRILLDSDDNLQDQGRFKPFTRHFTVENSGLGRALSMKIKLDYTLATNPSLQFIDLKYRRNTTDPWQAVTGAVSNNGVISVVIDFSAAPVGNSGIVYFEETVKLTACPTLNVNNADAIYMAQNFCGDELVTADTTYSTVWAHKDFPRLTTAVSVHDQDSPPICSGTDFVANVVVTNSGTGNGVAHVNVARDVKAVIEYTSHRATGAASEFQYFDNTDGTYKTLPVSPRVKQNPNGCTNTETDTISFESLTSDIDGPNYGLDDLDFDGKFDDLPQGAKLDLRIKFPTNESTTVCNTCADFYSYKIKCTGYWKTACGESGESSTPTPVEYPYLLSIGASTMEGPTDIVRNGPSQDVSLYVTGVYKTDLNLNCGDHATNFSTEVTLPGGYYIDTQSPVYWIAGGVTTELTSSEIIYQPGTTNVYTLKRGGVTGEYQFKVNVNCGQNLSASQMLGISWNVKYSCGGCSTPRTLICKTLEIYNHCIVCPAGVHTTSATAERTSMGWYLEGKSQPYSALKTPRLNHSSLTAAQKKELRLDRLMPYDTLVLSATGVISDTTSGITYSDLYVELSYQSPYPIEEFVIRAATIKVTDLPSNVITYYNVQSVAVHNRTGSPVKYTFPLPSGVVLGHGDKFDLSATLEVVQGIDSYSYLTGENILSNFRFYHYGKRSGDSQASSCESFGSRVSLISHYQSGYSTFSVPQYCVGANAIFVEYHNRPMSQGDYFGKEFRPWGAFTRIAYTGAGEPPFFAPHKMMQISADLYEETDLVPSQLPGPHSPNVWDYSMWRTHDDNNDMLLGLLLPLKCAPISDLSFNVRFQPYFYTLNSSVWAARVLNYTQTINNWSLFPNLSLTGSNTEQGVSREAVWELKLNNTGGDAGKTWAALEPDKDDLHIVKIVEKTANGTKEHLPARTYTTTSGRTGYMFELGTMFSWTTDLDVVAEYEVCDPDRIDTVLMKLSYGCIEYPATPYDVTCLYRPVLTKNLELLYRNAAMHQELDRLTSGVNGAYPACGAIEYQVKIKSVGSANINNVKFHLEFNEGASMNGVTLLDLFSYYYPNMATTGTLPAPVKEANSNHYIWNLSSLPPLSNNVPAGDLLGGIKAEGSGKDSIMIRFKVKTNCDFDPSLPLFHWYASANKNCGEPIPVVKVPEVIKIQGLDPLDKLEVTAKITSYDLLTKKVNFLVTVKNNSSESLFHYVGSGVKRRLYVGGYSPNATFTLENANPAIGGEHLPNEILFSYWDLTDMPAFSTSTFTGTYTTSSVNPTAFCPFNVIAHVRMLAPTSCNTTTCEMGTTISSDNDDIRENCCENCLPTLVLEEGKEYVVSVWVKQKQSTSATHYADAGISLYFPEVLMLRGPFYPSPSENIIDGWQRIDASFMVPEGAEKLEVRLLNNSSGDAYFDDLRIHPFHSSLKAFVYDPQTNRLWSELDERNYATFYEYDQEGGLIRVKKETEKGIMTITESRSNTIKVSKQAPR